MANYPVTGKDAMSVPNRHGQTGYVVLRVDIHPDIKTDLVHFCQDNDRTIKDVVSEAIKQYTS